MQIHSPAESVRDAIESPMRATSRLIAEFRDHYEADPDLVRIALNSTSWAEASLAVELLGEEVPERALVTAANIREAIKELPRCPLPMALEFETLARVWDLRREDNSWERTFDDADGEYTIVLLGEGNFCYDIVVRTAERTLMWMPRDTEEDFLHPDIVDLLWERSTLLDNVIDLAKTMGLVFSPLFYVSLQDWRHEYATAIFGEIVEAFGMREEVRRPAKRPVPLWDAERSVHRREDRRISFLG